MKIISNLEALELCSLSQNQRHSWIFKNVFLAYGLECVKFQHVENGDITSEYIASGLYDKFLELRQKVADSENILINCCACDIKATKWVMCLIRKITNNMNFGTCGEYVTVSGYDLQGFEVKAQGPKGDTLSEYTFNDVHKDGYTRLERSKMSASKKVDVVDVLKQWENRASRRALKNEVQFKTVTDSEGKQTSAQDFIKSNYGNPEHDLLNKCALLRARALITRIYHDTKNGDRIIDIVSSGRVMTSAERRAICDFRKRHNDLYDMIDYLTENLEIVEQ